MNNNGSANKQWRSMAEEDWGCLDSMTAEDQLQRGRGGSTTAWQRRINQIGHSGGGE
jgi:hypothetical protein